MDATSIHGATEARNDPPPHREDLTWSDDLQARPEHNFGPIVTKVDAKATSDVRIANIGNLVCQSANRNPWTYVGL
jgi:hypothetical protein